MSLILVSAQEKRAPSYNIMVHGSSVVEFPAGFETHVQGPPSMLHVLHGTAPWSMDCRNFPMCSPQPGWKRHHSHLAATREERVPHRLYFPMHSGCGATNAPCDSTVGRLHSVKPPGETLLFAPYHTRETGDIPLNFCALLQKCDRAICELLMNFAACRPMPILRPRVAPLVRRSSKRMTQICGRGRLFLRHHLSLLGLTCAVRCGLGYLCQPRTASATVPSGYSSPTHLAVSFLRIPMPFTVLVR